MKRICLLGLLFLFAGHARAQKLVELDKQVLDYIKTGEYQTAIPLAQNAIELSKKDSGEWHPSYARALNMMAILYFYLGKYDLAEPLYIQAKDIREKALGENHPDYLITLNNLAALYTSTGRYDKAEPLHLRVIALRKKILGEDHRYYAESLVNLALVYEYTGQYEKAEPLFIQAIAIMKKALGEEAPEVATCLNNLGVLYDNMRLYEKAEPLYVLAKDIREKSLGIDHPYFAQSLNNLGQLYVNLGRYAKAEELYLRALVIRRKAFGEEHPEYAQSLNNLANLYILIGQYEKAEPLLLREKDILKEGLGEESEEFATVLSSLAYLYKSMGKFEKAEPLMVRATEIRKKILGDRHRDYAQSLGNLAILYNDLGNFEKAESLYVQALEILKTAIGESAPDYAESLYNLGTLYVAMKKYEKAEPLFKESGRIFSQTLDEKHPFYVASLNSLGKLYSKTQRFELAEPLLMTSTAISLQNVKSIFSTLSEKEKGNYLARNVAMIEEDNSFLFKFRKATAAVPVNNYNLQLFFKSLSLADTKNMLEALRSNRDTTIQLSYNKWLTDKIQLAQQYSLPLKDRMKKLDSLEAETENIEKELARQSAIFRTQQTAFNIGVSVVREKLEENEAALEFVSFRYLNYENSDSLLYVAYLLRKNDSAPIFIPLFEEKQLQKILDSAGKSSTGMAVNLYRGIIIKGQMTFQLGKELFKLIWAPLEPYLKDIKKISYSPSGKLYGIAFHALPVNGKTLLMDKYKLRQYTSTREVAMRSGVDENARLKSISLFGDPRFSMDSLQMTSLRNNKRHDTVYSTSIFTPLTRGENSFSWPDLPGTAGEIKILRDLFTKNKIETRSFSQNNATEENLKALSGNSPQVMHIATHGFFLPKTEKKKFTGDISQQNNYVLAEDPLLRGGLILAGGNYAWSGKTPLAGVEDGIVTAYEISQMNLSNTELVVLSACETALGDIKGSEGVFGLQRAFKMAGVKKMILSLWQVPDKETAELMTSFYSYWLKGKTIEDAFAQAQTDMRKKYSPYYWAAFVLLE